MPIKSNANKNMSGIDFLTKNERPGHILIFRKTIRTKDGRIIRRPNGKSFPIWIKVGNKKNVA
jgi:hypothetical protein